MIDTKTQEVKAANGETYSDMRDLSDELPDSSPRFVLLSYPMTLVSLLPITMKGLASLATPSRMALSITQYFEGFPTARWIHNRIISVTNRILV